MAEKDLDTVRRRVASVANHLVPFNSSQNGAVELCNTSMKDSYHRVHGEVSSHEVVWRIASDGSGKEFTDIIYEKAEGEAIAKVGSCFRTEEFSPFCSRFIAEAKSF